MSQEKPFVGLLRVLTGMASYLPSLHLSWLRIRLGSMIYIKHFHSSMAPPRAGFLLLFDACVQDHSTA